MTWFSALLPVRDGVGVHAALDRQARRLRADGDQRTLGQLRADLLVAWILHPSLTTDATRTTTTTQTTTKTQTAGTTQTAATTQTETQTAASGAPGPNRGAGNPPVMVNLVVPDTVLLGDHTTHNTTHDATHGATHGADGAATGWVEGHGPVPGDLLREWIAERLDADTGSDVTAWVRRVYTNPAGGLVAMDSRAGYFTGHLAEYLRLRDRRCRTPYCDARIRHLDHVIAKVDGGPTTAENGQGLCEACNYAKQAPG